MSDEDIGRLIRERREQLGWSQSELGVRFGVGQTAISYYEAGKRSLSAAELIRMARLLGVQPDYFFDSRSGTSTEDGERPRLIAFYDDMTPEGQDDLLNIAEAIWRKKRRGETTHGRKAE
jgi:transcriptional regulator with XRE-family HTH domain